MSHRPPSSGTALPAPPFAPGVGPAESSKLEAPLIALTQQCGGDLRKLLYVFFAFLNRRTDFYLVPNQRDLDEGVPTRMGFREGDAEKLLLAAFRQFPLRRLPRQGGGGGEGMGKADTKAAVATTKTGTAKANSENETRKEPAVGHKALSGKPSGEQTSTVGSGGGQDGQIAASEIPTSSLSTSSSSLGMKELSTPLAETAAAKAAAENSSTSFSSPPAKKEADLVRNVRRTEDGKQIPVGNGGVTERYHWTQTIDEVTAVIAVPDGTRGKDVQVSIRPTRVSVSLKSGGGGDSPILDGVLAGKVRPDESTWSLEGGALLLTLDKAVKTWWGTVLEGDDEIDTSLVDSTRSICEYDEATQGAIRKIMFDQRQERMGLPTSDEILGTVPKIPPLPDGVEYIDRRTFEKEEEEGSQNDGEDVDRAVT